LVSWNNSISSAYSSRDFSPIEKRRGKGQNSNELDQIFGSLTGGLDSFMSVDVIIPVRNGEPYIGECLDSVLNQSAISLISRILVINDGSEDNTVEIVEKYSDQSSKVELHSTGPRGLSTARNYGLDLSTSENIAFLDSDDLWKPDKIDSHFYHLSEHPDCLFSFTLASEFRANSEINWPQGINPAQPTFSSLLLQQFRIYGSGSSVFVNRQLARLNGGFDESMNYGEDWDFWLKLSLHQLPCQLSENATLIRIHPLSMQRTKRVGDERFLNSSVHFREWAKYPQIFQDLRFKDVALRIMWADFRKNFGFRGILSTDYCIFLFAHYGSVMHQLRLKRNRLFNLMLFFHRLKRELWSVRH
jgi:glycosyltransferase involved in cell wall biosynthesis